MEVFGRDETGISTQWEISFRNFTYSHSVIISSNLSCLPLGTTVQATLCEDNGWLPSLSVLT